MAINKKVPIKIEIEQESGDVWSIDLKVKRLNKKDAKKIKKISKELDKKNSELNDRVKKRATLNSAIVDIEEEINDISLILEDKQERKNIELIKERLSLRKELKKLKDEQSLLLEDGDDEKIEEIREELFEKQIELMVDKSEELLTYAKKEGVPLFVLLQEIINKLGEAEGNF